MWKRSRADPEGAQLVAGVVSLPPLFNIDVLGPLHGGGPSQGR